MGEPDTVQTFRQARALYQEEQYAQALALFERVEEEHPENPSVWHAHAWCLARVGRYVEARELCRKLKRLNDPRATEIHDFLESQRLAEEIEARPKNPDTVISSESVAPAPQVQWSEPAAPAGAPRTWKLLRAGGSEPAPGGIQCARAVLVAVAVGGSVLLLSAFASAAVVLQSRPVRPDVEPALVAGVMLGLAAAVTIISLAVLAWQQIPTGRSGLAFAAALMLLLLFPIGTALGLLVLLGISDRESKKWLQRAALRSPS
jgi:tetratricopeptide (TPR) repeat protein